MSGLLVCLAWSSSCEETISASHHNPPSYLPNVPLLLDRAVKTFERVGPGRSVPAQGGRGSRHRLTGKL